MVRIYSYATYLSSLHNEYVGIIISNFLIVADLSRRYFVTNSRFFRVSHVVSPTSPPTTASNNFSPTARNHASQIAMYRGVFKQRCIVLEAVVCKYIMMGTRGHQEIYLIWNKLSKAIVQRSTKIHHPFSFW